MAQGKYVSYLRVSTKRQGSSGLGLEAQRQAVADYLNGGNWELVEEFVEIESGTKDSRPELAKALDACRIYGATLVVAKLDRLARDAAFLLNLQKSGVEFIAADMPEANRLTVGILAMVAEDEARRISQRTKDALAAAKARGVTLGNPANLSPEGRMKGSRIASEARQQRASKRAALLAATVEEIQTGGATSLRQIAGELNRRGVRTARGAGQWSAMQVKRLLERIGTAAGVA